MRMSLAGMRGFGIQFAGLLKPFDCILAPPGLFIGIPDLDARLWSRILIRPGLMIQDERFLVLL